MTQVQTRDGRRLNVRIAGEGPIRVIFECGLGVPGSEWVVVQRLLAPDLATLAYDRAGYGTSDPASDHRSLECLASDLEDVINASAGAPVLLVGHSWGGPIIRTLVAKRPDLVQALVLIDPSHEQAMGAGEARFASALYGFMSRLGRFGVQKPVLRAFVGKAFDGLDAADRTLIEGDFYSAQSVRAGSREARRVRSGLAELKRVRAESHCIAPTVLIVGALPDLDGMKARRRLHAAAEADTRNLPNVSLVVAEHSSHFVPQQQPDLVAEVVRSVLAGRQGGERP